MYKVKTYNTLAPAGLEILSRKGYKYGEEVTEPQAILCRSQNLHDEDLPDSLLGIFRAGSGVNNIPVDECTKKGIAVFNAPGANSNSVKELVIGTMISLNRHVLQGLIHVKSLTGDDVAEQIERDKKAFNGHEIAGQKLGVIGLGNIGSKVAQAALDLGMKVIGYDPYSQLDESAIDRASFRQVSQASEVFENSDIITIHVPVTDDTYHLVNDNHLALTKAGVILINFARKEIVDSQAVERYIDNGHIKAFATDFYDENLADYPNVYITPHLGASTAEAQSNAVVMAAQSLVLYLETGEIENSVNLPNLRLPFESPYRLAIINHNIPNMIAEIATRLGQLHINIDKIANQARGEIAYTLIDVSGEGLEDKLPGFIDEMQAFEGIVRVRLIDKS